MSVTTDKEAFYFLEKGGRKLTTYIYTYACNPEEEPLCKMEMRALFDHRLNEHFIKSKIKIEPERSPFIRERIEVIFEGDTWQAIAKQAESLTVEEESFKVLIIKDNDLVDKLSLQERRMIERAIGQSIKGRAELVDPAIQFAAIPHRGRWYFGRYKKGEAIWLKHQQKPREYSTALSTRMARAVVNIAVPKPEGIKAIDPCCGIGTVLVEALSMGINIVGRDIKPLPAIGARENVAHFGYKCDIKKGAIEEVTDHYDAAIIDLPYNLCHTATPEEQLSILKHANRIADRVVVVTGERIDNMMKEAGLVIRDRCKQKKRALREKFYYVTRIKK